MEGLPDELKNIIKDYLIFKPKNKEELRKAVDLWCDNKEEGIKKYGDISIWNTSLIVDMSNLFINKYNFNDNISNWDVSSVTDMSYMFNEAWAFNQPLDLWDVTSETNTDGMFDYAKLSQRCRMRLCGWY